MPVPLKTLYLTHPQGVLHDMGPGHPESPARLKAIENQLKDTGLIQSVLVMTAGAATREQVERVHEAAYLDELEQASPNQGLVQLDPDTAMNPFSLNAAYTAAGAGVSAIDAVMRGEVKNAFCAVRPPGHHAERARSMGFCIINHVCVAAAHALETYGLKRIAIIDFDVHHGNGTENIFAHDPRVLMVSTFQHPFYPYSGVEGRSKRMVNIPLPARSGSQALRSAVQDHWLPALADFSPELILISAGFDAHEDDPLASLQWQDEDYGWLTQQMMQVAERSAKGRLVSMLEGGYGIEALGRCVELHVRTLAGLDES